MAGFNERKYTRVMKSNVTPFSAQIKRLKEELANLELDKLNLEYEIAELQEQDFDYTFELAVKAGLEKRNTKLNKKA